MIKIEKEIELSIVEDYKNGLKRKDICEKYRITNFYKILDKYDVPRFNKKWTQDELDKLNELYPTESWELILKEIKRFPREEIIRMASKMKIRRENFQYTYEEIEYLKKYYCEMPTKIFIEKFFPNRTESAIHTKASRMGLVSREAWSNIENEILQEYYPSLSNKSIRNLYLNNRSLSAIMCQAANLGLKKEKTNTHFSKEELICDLKKLANNLGRTPTLTDISISEDLPSPMTYYRYFGSYDNACSIASLPINHINTFGSIGFHEASDGTICLSQAELTITEFFISNNITFEKEVPYTEFSEDERCGMKRCDWLLSDGTIVEYFGMPELEHYKKKMTIKLDIIKNSNLKFVALYRKDLSKLHKIFKPLTNVSTVTTKR
ncbi:homing endonuclease associated repeat-containing protein [Paenibacillus sp. M2]|uniref:homing endonuclease associated repeat-containing protein n=1 Tax=Paenibacillus sp. M2 TaxID=3341793 RepID=UPI00398A05BD